MNEPIKLTTEEVERWMEKMKDEIEFTNYVVYTPIKGKSYIDIESTENK